MLYESKNNNFYAPRVGLSNDDKLLACISSLKGSEIHVIAGDFNGRVGEESVTFDTYYGGKGYGTRNPEELRWSYSNAKFNVQINGSSSESFKVTVGVHQGSVLSHLLFIIMMEALSREFRASGLRELLYANNLAILSDSLVDHLRCSMGGYL